MKRFLVGGIALLLAAATPAIADQHRPGGGAPHMRASRPAAAHMSRPSAAVRVRVPRATASVRVHRPVATHRHVWSSTHNGARHTVHWTAGHNGRHVTRHPVASTHRFAKVRRAVRANRRFHAGIYRRPHGWYNHHWRLGQRLPRGWFARDYWISDWAIYGLWAPIDDLIWVRVGPDAMLIDPVTGEIVSVDYGIFW